MCFFIFYLMDCFIYGERYFKKAEFPHDPQLLVEAPLTSPLFQLAKNVRTCI